jgi:hypothetical protein
MTMYEKTNEMVLGNDEGLLSDSDLEMVAGGGLGVALVKAAARFLIKLAIAAAGEAVVEGVSSKN